MPHDRIERNLRTILAEKDESGASKGKESIVTGVLPASGELGPRYLLAGEGERPFLRMNANAYLSMGLRAETVAAEEVAVRAVGTGPGAVRFISGTYQQHIELEQRLAAFHR